MTLSRSPMKRGTVGLKTTKPMRRGVIAVKKPGAENKPASGKPRPRKCAICRTAFEPRTMTHKACKPECAEEVAKRVAAKQKARQQRQERAEDRGKREDMKTYPQLIKEAQKAFNAYIRHRDAGRPCICCGRTSEKEYLTGTNWDSGHYRSTGSAPHLRFHEDNVHRQLVYCNRHGAGRAVDYRIGLIARIGLARVEALECDNKPANWSHDDLRAIRDAYRARLRKEKKEAGNV